MHVPSKQQCQGMSLISQSALGHTDPTYTPREILSVPTIAEVSHLQSHYSPSLHEANLMKRKASSIEPTSLCLWSLVHPTCLHYPREQKRPRTLYLARKGCLPPVISMSSSRSSMQRTGRPVLGQGETKKVRNL